MSEQSDLIDYLRAENLSLHDRIGRLLTQIAEVENQRDRAIDRAIALEYTVKGSRQESRT